MHTVNVTQAKSQLSSLLREIEKQDHQIVIERAGKPVATLTKYKPRSKNNRIDSMEGLIKIADDFDELPRDIALSFGMID